MQFKFVRKKNRKLPTADCKLPTFFLVNCFFLKPEGLVAPPQLCLGRPVFHPYRAGMGPSQGCSCGDCNYSRILFLPLKPESSER